MKFINNTIIQKGFHSVTALPGQAHMTQRRTVVALYACFTHVISVPSKIETLKWKDYEVITDANVKIEAKPQ